MFLSCSRGLLLQTARVLPLLLRQTRRSVGGIRPGAGDPPVPHRQFVFALLKVLRPAFRYRRRLLPKLALCAWKALSSFLREDTGGDALPAAIVSIQTAGEFLNRHPHLHVLAPAGAFRTDGSFIPSPVFDAAVLRDNVIF